MICKLSTIVEKQEKAMEVLTMKIIHLESTWTMITGRG
jgi:hypothetical protein